VTEKKEAGGVMARQYQKQELRPGKNVNLFYNLKNLFS